MFKNYFVYFAHFILQQTFKRSLYAFATTLLFPMSQLKPIILVINEFNTVINQIIIFFNPVRVEI